MLKCRIHCQQPELEDIIHNSTIYQIGTSVFLDELDENGDLKNVIKEVTSSNDKERYEIDIDLEDVDENTVLYARSKFIFSKNGQNIITNWSRPITLMPNIQKLSMSDTIVQTPSVSVSSDTNHIYIKSSDFELYSGLGEHYKTGYTLTNTDNEVLLKREDDVDNLNTIYVENQLQSGKIYKANVKHGTLTTNGYDGSSLISTYSSLKEMFGFEAPEQFIINRKWYYRVKIYSNDYTTYDLQIRAYDGSIIDTYLGLTELTGYILPTQDKYEVGQQYILYIKLNFANNTTTKYGYLYSTFCNKNEILNYEPKLNYKNKFKLLEDRDISSDIISIERETFDGKLIAYDVATNSLALYNNDTNTTKIMDFYKFNTNESVSYLNVIQLANHDILADVTIYSNQNPITKFLLFEYNTIKTTVSLIAELSRVNEKLSTAVSNSLVSSNDGRVFYIPARYLDDDNAETKLPLIELCINIEHIPSSIQTYFLTVDSYNIKGKVYSIANNELDTYKELLELVKEYYRLWSIDPKSMKDNEVFSSINNVVTYEFMLGEIQRINELQENGIILEEDRLNRDKILKKLSILKLTQTISPKDITTLSLKTYELPYFSKFFSSLFLDRFSNIYVYNGSFTQFNTKEVVTVNDGKITVGVEEYYNRENPYIYKFNKDTNTFTRFAKFQDVVPLGVYNLHAFLRNDDRVVFFNSSYSGDNINYEQFIIFDPTEYPQDQEPNRWSYKSINGEMNITFRSMKIYQNGSCERLTNTMQTLITDEKLNSSSRKLKDEGSTEVDTEPTVTVNGLLNKEIIVNGVLTKITDPKNYVGKYLTNVTKQKVLRYSPYDTELPTFDLQQDVLTTLIVNDNEVITIDDIYKYKSYSILGSGVLRWKRPTGIIELYSTDWIVTHDDLENPIAQGTLANKKYESILLLDGVRLKIQDKN